MPCAHLLISYRHDKLAEATLYRIERRSRRDSGNRAETTARLEVEKRYLIRAKRKKLSC